MRHHVRSRTFGRNPSHRKFLYNQLVTSLIEHGRITTTLTRAKAIRPLVDRVITYAKDGSLNAKRAARRVILKKEAFKRLFDEVRNDFQALSNQGGYSRIIKWKRRRGDNAPLVLMELLNFKSKTAGTAGTESGTTGAPETEESVTAAKSTTATKKAPVKKAKKKTTRRKKVQKVSD